MKEIEELLLLSGQDIPYISARLQIHQPRLKDIAVVGERNFIAGISVLKLDKSLMKFQDNAVLDKISNFDIIMMMIENPSPETQIMKTNVMMILAILFPTCTIEIKNHKIILREESNKEEEKIIDANNYEEFCAIVDSITCFNLGSSEPKLNPKSKMAARIAEKLKRGRQKAAQSKGENLLSVLSLYASVLAVGEMKDINSLMNYTMYQLFEEYKRYSAKLQFDMNIQMRLAGAKDVSEPKNWMDNLDDKSSVTTL